MYITSTEVTICYFVSMYMSHAVGIYDHYVVIYACKIPRPGPGVNVNYIYVLDGWPTATRVAKYFKVLLKLILHFHFTFHISF